MVETRAKKAQQLMKSLLSEGHIDEMTADWLFLTPDRPWVPVFYTLTKIHKLTPVGRPIISGCSGPTERIQHLFTTLFRHDPPWIPVFYTLTKIHKLTPVGRPIISGCSGPTERIQHLFTTLFRH